jgi:hypothetical protein
VVAGTLPLTFRCRRGALAVYGLPRSSSATEVAR